MDQELMTIIQNIEALVAQAKQSMGAETAEKDGMAEDPNDMVDKIMRAIGSEDEGSEEDKKEDKEEVKKSAEGATASDKAEENVLGDNPTEENINEVAKTIAKLLTAKKVMKSKPESDKEEIYKIMKSLAGEVVEVKKAVSSMIEGMGIAEQISQPVKRPMNNLDEIQKSLDQIKGIAAQKNEDKGLGDTSHYVAKSLADDSGALLRGIFHRNSR